MAIYHRVLITGAAGVLGTQLRAQGPALAEITRLSDREPIRNLAGHEEDQPADLGDLLAVLRAVEGCDAIVHLGAHAVEGSWTTVLNANIVGTYNLYEAARQSGVRRVVYASSIHAVGFYERATIIDANAPVRPDSLYGVSKAFGETLSRYYFDKFGIESVCVRIGSCLLKPRDRRQLSTWISYRDFLRFIEDALLADRVGHLVAMPTSKNSSSFWDDRIASVLGFRPLDSADDFRDEVLATTCRGDPNDPAIRFQGGSFCSAGHVTDSCRSPPTPEACNDFSAIPD